MNNITDIAIQLPNMEALNDIAYIKTADRTVGKTNRYRSNRVKAALQFFTCDMTDVFEKDIREAIENLNETGVLTSMNEVNLDCDADNNIEPEFTLNNSIEILRDDELINRVNNPNCLLRKKYTSDMVARKYEINDFIYLAFPILYCYISK